MFEIGDYVVNASNGICRIAEITHLDVSMSDRNKLYYLLIPLEEKTAKVYVPVDATHNRIRKLISPPEAMEFIDSIPEIEEMWIENDKQREQIYKEAIQSCNPEKLVSILKCMYRRRLKRNAQGKKNTAVDDRCFKMAEKNLFDELAFALKKDKVEVHDLVTEHMQ